jgi:hypothetical protein
MINIGTTRYADNNFQILPQGLVMRVAVLFYGRILHFDKKLLLKSLDCRHNIDIFYSCDGEPAELVDDFKELYEPVEVNNEKIEYSVDCSGYTKGIENIDNMFRHFINLKRVFELLTKHISKTGIIYDLVIVTRLDLQIISLELILPEQNTIYIPYGEDYCGLNDRFAMGTIDTIRHYTSIFDNCKYLLDNNLAILHPEILTRENIKYCKIDIKRFSIIYKLYGRENMWCNGEYK